MRETSLRLSQDSEALLRMTDHTNRMGGTGGQKQPQEVPADKSTASNLFIPHTALSTPAPQSSAFFFILFLVC